MENNIQDIINKFCTFYSANKNNKKLDGLTNFLLREALSAQGYNNYKNQEDSGELFFINEILKRTKPSLCIDVGANEGDYSIALLKSTQAQIVAFEPLPSAFSKLTQVTQEFSSRIRLENMGVGPTEETLTINFNLAAMAHASFCKEVNQISYLNNNKTLDVPVMSLDTYCERNYIDAIDLIKIDVEGFELEVFKGAYNVFNNIRPRFIQIEFNEHQLFRNTTLHFFANQLKDYVTYQLLPGRWEKRDSRDPLSNIFQFSNFVFVRPDIDVTLI